MSKNSEIDFQLIEEEMIKCKDPVYFYERYCGVKQHSGVLEYPTLSEDQKRSMRIWFGIIDPNKTA